VVAVATIETSEELTWLFELFGTSQSPTTIEYLVRPSADEVRLLLPISPPPAAAAALRRVHSDRTWSQRLQTVGGRAAGRLGLLGRAPGQVVRLPAFELVEHLARTLGEPELLAAVTLGVRRRNRKPVLQLLRPDGRVVGFAKVGWSPLTTELVANEHRILAMLPGQLPPSVIAPSVLAVEHWRDLTVTVTSELRPPPLARGSAPGIGHIVSAIAAARPGPDCGVARSATLTEGIELGLGDVVDIDRLVNRHDGVVLSTGLWHGDFTPWNLVGAGRSVMIWDWEFAALDRPVGFDALHHLFEFHRRSPGGTNERALEATMLGARNALNAVDPDLTPTRRRAIVDLYLCELAGRERRLSNQRWSGGDLATLDGAVTTLLQRRLQ